MLEGTWLARIVMELLKKSEYFMSFSADFKARYRSKVICAGPTTYPYCIEGWTETREVVPSVQWSDVMLYMVSTPIPYTHEEMKVSNAIAIARSILSKKL